MDSEGSGSLARAHSVSVVVPVYQGERTLGALLAEIAPLTQAYSSPAGHRLHVAEVLLVHDNGPDASAAVIRQLALVYPFVRPIWLSRNFGQHPATLAGMASSGSDWIVTLDEDGQHDPAFIGSMLDVAMTELADVVYAHPTNEPPHGVVRNLASRTSKRLLRLSTSDVNATEFQSFRLVLGEIGRSVAAYAGAGVYLDVALAWVARKVATAPIVLREEGSRPSGYSLRSLTSHFWRMVLSSGTRALRLVSLLGIVFAVGGFLLALYFLIAASFWDVSTPQGWPSLMVALLVCSGAILFSLGIIAEYIGVAVNMAMGKPLYLIVSDPGDGPMGRAMPTLPVHPGQHTPGQTPFAPPALPTVQATVTDPAPQAPDLGASATVTVPPIRP
ncbi:undecaprenyl-phosphate 4-deoxy-4-formamido-L-arabinose transferase [Nakamurella sp. UYEF19]|uniref:glycosyltransferase n=1 Tax=Nakamurella sp. UYEF19 TaxID=1756392 RepID=UPI00339AA79C